MASRSQFATVNGMPALSVRIDVLFLHHWQVLLTGGYDSHEPTRNNLTWNAVRSVDTAILRYEAASRQLDLWLGTTGSTRIGFSYLMRCGCYLQDCVSAAHQATTFLEELVKLDVADPTLGPTSDQLGRIAEMRHAIQHTNERITGKSRRPYKKGEDPAKVKRGEAGQVLPTDTTVRLGSAAELPYQTLADTITRTHDAVADTLGHRPGCGCTA